MTARKQTGTPADPGALASDYATLHAQYQQTQEALRALKKRMSTTKSALLRSLRNVKEKRAFVVDGAVVVVWEPTGTGPRTVDVLENVR